MKDNRNKDDALRDFLEMCRNSWTWDRLTASERSRFEKTLNNGITAEALRGPYLQRWRILQALYTAFLDGIGYQPDGWREPKKTH